MVVKLDVIFMGSCGVPNNQVIHLEHRVLGLHENYGDAHEGAYHDQDDRNKQEDAQEALAAARPLATRRRAVLVQFSDPGIVGRWDPIDLVLGNLDDIGAGGEGEVGCILVDRLSRWVDSRIWARDGTAWVGMLGTIGRRDHGPLHHGMMGSGEEGR